MTIKLFCNSVGTRKVPNPNSDNNYPIFPELIKSEIYYSLLVSGTWNHIKDMNLENDIVIFNVGINDCVFRKDRGIQIPLLVGLINESESIHDDVTIRLASKKIFDLTYKSPDKLIQLLTFHEFDKYLDMIFKKVDKGIVLSVLWFSPDAPKMGYAYNEIIQINSILQHQAIKHKLIYIDLFHPPVLTFDDVHLTKEGHEVVAKKIKKAITAMFK